MRNGGDVERGRKGRDGEINQYNAANRRCRAGKGNRQGGNDLGDAGRWHNLFR